MPRGALCLLDVFIPIFADDWNQLSAVAIAYFPLSGWWMWSHLSDCAGFPVSSDIEGLSICAMDRAHQKGWIKPCRKAITNTPLLLWLFMTQRFQCMLVSLPCMQFRGTQILFVNECLVNMNSLYQVIQPVYRFNYIVHIGCKYWREISHNRQMLILTKHSIQIYTFCHCINPCPKACMHFTAVILNLIPQSFLFNVLFRADSATLNKQCIEVFHFIFISTLQSFGLTLLRDQQRSKNHERLKQRRVGWF